MTNMAFSKKMRGYDPAEVDKYIAELSEREGATRRAQKERIDELSEENYNLRERIAELTRRENDIAEALITAQAVARDMEQHAQDCVNKALFEAKKFYATWQAYSKTIIATFTDDEVAAFTSLERKIGDVIASYERKLSGEDVEQDVTATVPKKPRKTSARSSTPEEFVRKMEQATEELNVRAEKKSKEQPAADESLDPNPITRVQQAAGQTIDLRELLRPEQSLEDLCADLGLIDTDEDVDGE